MFTRLVSGFIRQAKKRYRLVIALMACFVYSDSIIIFSKKIDTNTSGALSQIKEYGADVNEILGVYKMVGRYNCYAGSDDDYRMSVRLRKGMKFYAAFEGDRVAAYMWLHTVNHRFIDEVGVVIEHGTDELWLRDAYVVPNKRGKRLFGDVLNTVIRKYHLGTSCLYSDVMADNKSSRRAHKHLGMTQIGRVRFTRIMGRVLYRNIDVQNLKVDGYKFPQKFLSITDDFRSYIRSNRC